MNVDCDDHAERQARLDWMIKEFREAQTRRNMKSDDKVVEPKPDAILNAPRPDTPLSQ
jgi:hypothetical protein